MSGRRKIDIYDTTLRDGAQGEGVSFSGPSKVRLALQLDEFGADYIEGGYAGSSQKDLAFFQDIRRHSLRHAKVAAFGSTRRADVRVGEDANVVSLIQAATPTVTVFGKTWLLHVTEVLRTTVDENCAMVADTVRYLKEQGKEVFFDAEHFFDGYKDSPGFALLVLKAAATAGADALVLCDTNGGSLPHEVYGITAEVLKAVGVPVGIHTHNDAGLAVATSLEAVRAGAAQVQGTINGYGERCGNANLCTIIPTLELKMGLAAVPAGRLAQLRSLSQFVDEMVGLRHDGKAPYVGESAFSHKAGMHVNAVQKNPRTFEHIPPETVGNERRILISEGSGTSSVLLKAIELGVDLKKSSPEVKGILDALKELERQGYTYEAADASFRMLIQKLLKKHRSFFDLEGFRVIIEKPGKSKPCVSEASIKVRVGKEIEHTVAEGDGPVNALDRALRKVLTRFYPEIAKVHLTDFRVRILDPSEATAAKTRVIIESSDGEDSWSTVGVSGNLIEACWEALVDSVEYKLFREEEQAQHPPGIDRNGPAATRG
jgi:2-isopropylmalate synthase